MSYFIHRAAVPPGLDDAFDSPVWSPAETARLRQFRPEGGSHRPDVAFKLQYDRSGLYGLFLVEDRYVRCRAKNFQDMVCNDSCVEFFVQPAGGTGYLNFEFNASGVLLCQQVRDHRRPGGPISDARFLTEAEVEGIRVFHTLPDQVPEELPGPVSYRVGFFIPFAVFAKTHGVPVPEPGSVWRGNFYKCGDKTSHPHWVSYWPLDRLAFHNPDFFGLLRFC